MKAIVFDSFQGTLEVRQVPLPEPPDEGVRIKVMAAGLCRSDWHGWMGHDNDISLPHIPGHEFAGIVDAIGKGVLRFKPGDRVTAPFVCGCGKCAYCDQGDHQVCPQQTQPGFTHDGCFAEFVTVNSADTNLSILPEDLAFTAAASLGCRFITAYRGLVQQGVLKKDQIVAIYGCGGVGLSCILIALAMEAVVIAIDIDESSLKLARELGAQVTVHANDDPVDTIQNEFGGADIAVDALGSSETARNGIDSLRRRGKFIQIGLMTGADSQLSVDMSKVIAHELEILGSHGMSASYYPQLFDWIQQSKIPLYKLIGKTIALAEVPDALPQMGSNSSTGITIVQPWQT